MTPKVVDLSHHNKFPDLIRLKSEGILAIIHKATEGTTFVDKTYAARMEAAREAGLGWGAYHFLRPGDMQAQMKFFVQTARLLPGEQLCIDHEDAGVSLSKLRDAVLYLRDLAPNNSITIYSGHLIKEQVGSTKDSILADCALWLAQYTTGTPSWPKATWPTYTLWQYTDKGTAGGVSPLDLNEFNGSDANCLKFFNVAGSSPEPEPEPVSDVLRLNVTVSLRVTVDADGSTTTTVQNATTEVVK